MVSKLSLAMGVCALTLFGCADDPEYQRMSEQVNMMDISADGGVDVTIAVQELPRYCSDVRGKIEQVCADGGGDVCAEVRCGDRSNRVARNVCGSGREGGVTAVEAWFRQCNKYDGSPESVKMLVREHLFVGPWNGQHCQMATLDECKTQ